MSETLRAFISIELPDKARNAASSYITHLARQNKDYKWVARRNLHITLAFLGEVPIEDSVVIKDAIRRSVIGIEPFEAGIGALGTFASVVWLGIDQGEETLRKIYTNLNSELIMANIQLDERKFHPHITIARSRRRMTPEEKLWFEEGRPPEGVTFMVNKISLMESQLSPKGPEYTEILGVELEG